MAPIFSTAVGVTPQIIDDTRLRQLLDSLNKIELKDTPHLQCPKSSAEVKAPLDITKLFATLEPFQTWIFEEQVDLHEWIHTLNTIDAALTYFIQKYPSLLLIGPVKRKRGRGVVDAEHQLLSCPAESLDDVSKVPDSTMEQICVFLRFLSSLLKNAASKSVFNSVEELVDLLAAADDTVSSLALEVLCNLAVPPSLHKQQSPEVNQHTTSLHNSKTSSHRRLIALARGWGTRGSGLGLYTCVTVDDSEFGQGSLPQQAGELDFAFSAALDKEEAQSSGQASVPGADFQLVRIHLSQNEIVEDVMQTDSPIMTEDNMDVTSDGDTIEASKKRRKVGPVGSKARETKSTADLFFRCIEKAGGRKAVPEDRLFSLLADIRLARSFHSNATRVEAVERRLRALVTILHSHPSQEIMSGYFQAQPELCVELIDLLRPTVSSANVSAASARPKQGSPSSPMAQDALGALADSPNIPYNVRMLAIEALTALVARRDGTSGALTGAARHSSVLNELGVGKGQYLGLLPTLIRFSLASLGSSFASDRPSTATSENSSLNQESADFTLDVGLAFVEATMKPSMPRIMQLSRALEFIDAVLTLTSAIVSTPTGTSALTDCGLIPALLTTAAMDSQTFIEGTMPNISSFSKEEILRVESLLRFITAQAIQILEGAIVTHNNALSAFHDLQGVEVLTSRLSREVMETRKNAAVDPSETSNPSAMDCEPTEFSSQMKDVEMEIVDSKSKNQRRILSSQRVLLFSIVTCLTVVFHQESTSSSVTVPSGGAQLRKPELTQALIEIMDDVNSYGGHLASLIATLLSDVLNSDPHVVHHVHKSGLAKSFMNMLLGKRIMDDAGTERCEPILPPVPELIMALPNVISALALTEDGAKAVKEANPFPSILRLFYHPNYAMPKSRCLLNEMTAIVGTGLDEVMRHVQSLKPLVLSALSEALNKIVSFAEDLARREEEKFQPCKDTATAATDIENERTCLMQYVLNFGQLLEQILHNEDHCEPFVAAGGLDALLKLFPCVMPTGYQFLAHVSSLSCPSVSTLHHSTSEESLCLAFKCIFAKYDPLKLIQTVGKAVNLHLQRLEATEAVLRNTLSPHVAVNRSDFLPYDATFILEGIPREPLHMIATNEHETELIALSKYLSSVSTVQWITSLLGTAIKSACQRGQESGTGWSRSEREWKKELSSNEFENLVGSLSRFHQSAVFEVCRIRTNNGFENRERDRLATCSDRCNQLLYRLRIVCPEGAVVRDGIEIDSCASVGSMEMGEIAEAFDRCINSSGILRYRTRRGWVSEMTRGHGREPIAEVISLRQSDKDDFRFKHSTSNKRRIEARVPDLCSVGASVLARVQTSYSELFNALSRTVIQGVRSLPARTVSFEAGTVGAHVATTMRILSSNIDKGINQNDVVKAISTPKTHDHEISGTISRQGAAMYLGCMLSHLHACLFEEKRERRMVNVPLLLFLLESDSRCENGKNEDGKVLLSFFDAVKFVFSQSLDDFEERSKNEQKVKEKSDGTGKLPHQRIDRTVAASLPPSVSLLRRLMSGPLISSSPAASVLSRIKQSDLAILISGNDDSCKDETLFSPEGFVRRLHFAVSEVVKETWIHPKFMYAPPHVVHPFATLVGDIVVGLEEASKKRSSLDSRSSRSESNQWDFFRSGSQGRRREIVPAAPPVEEIFEPNEDTISRLTEMGFSRDHALDALESTQSNRVEIAMEYALSHPPPSPASIERRRAMQQERQRRRDEQRRRAAEAAVGQRPAEAEAETEAEANQSADSPQEEAANNTSNAEAMDVESGQEKPKKEEPKDDNDMVKAKSLLKSWITEASRVSCDVIAGLSFENASPIHEMEINKSARSDEGTGEGDGEGEALTVVLCSFLLDLCQRYPDERTRIVTQILDLMKSLISERKVGDAIEIYVTAGRESSMAALCHAALLFTRALPKTRSLILRANLVSSLVSCIQGFLKSLNQDKVAAPGDEANSLVWPMWLAPAILLLDVVAQPVVAFSKKSSEGDDKEAAKSSEKSEYNQVQDEHKMLLGELTEVANKIFSSIRSSRKGSTDAFEEPKEEKMTETGEANSKAQDGIKKANEAENAFSSIPAYYPLLPLDSVEPCLEICMELLRKGKDATGEACPPPGVVHATLLLLLRLLRTPKLSSHCLQMGAAEAILSLPRECRFTGNSGLVTLILRRLLEDESTLQSAMETEIRGTVTKLYGKRKESMSGNEKPSIARNAFMQAITPLLCRDPVSFLKALTLSVEMEGSKDSSDSNVTLLSPEERSRNFRALSEVVKLKKPSSSSTGASGKPSSSRRRSGSTSRQRRGSGANLKSKSPGRCSLKQSKKSKRERNDEKSTCQHQHQHHTLNGTPANHITSLLIVQVMLTSSANAEKSSSSDTFADDKSFLWTANLLEILADLVLAVPACASVVQKYRPQRSKDRSSKSTNMDPIPHALSGCHHPPKTFVSFLLHSILPQDRWNIKNDQKIWERHKDSDIEESEELVAKKKRTYRLNKVSQTAARLLVALVARPGEGRRRVIAELAFALSGGRLGHSSISTLQTSPRKALSNARDLNALQAWGELCIGLAAPRSTGKNPEGDSSLSFEVIKLMLEFGMAHALLFAIQLVRLQHPMAASTCSALLLPFEILVRGKVSDVVRSLADKEIANKELKGTNDTTKEPSPTDAQADTSIEASGASGQQGDMAFSDEVMLEEAFHEEVLTRPDNSDLNYGLMVQGEENDGDHEDDGDDDVEMDDDVDDEGSEDDMSSSSESDESSEVGNSDDDDDSEGEDEDDGSLEESDEVSSEEMEEVDEGDWNVNYREDIAVDQESDEADEDGMDQADSGLDEGWTRIESSAFGGMLLGGRRNALSATSGPLTARTRGFIDAAEAMIGTLLRTGEIHGDALAEIEGSLGIRIMSNGRSLRAFGSSGMDGDPISVRLTSSENRNVSQNPGEVVGTLPHVHQRSQPDLGYSALSGGGRWIEISSMEYVYGGPSVTAGSRNYDLVSPLQVDDENDNYPSLSQLDLQLFPGGPASAAHARTQHSLHPLLCGVDLPPVNSLVSDLLPHGVRATRRGQMTTRRPGDWTNTSLSPGSFLVLTSNGNIVRSNRSHNGAPLSLVSSGRNAAGPVGWTDDGLPFDATVEEFSSAFERALGDSMSSLQEDRTSSNENRERTNNRTAATSDADGSGEHGSNGDRAERAVSSTSAPPTQQSEQQESSVASAGIPTEQDANENQQQSNPSDGDGVASSLAEGLRLSPRSEASAASDRMSTGNAGDENAVTDQQVSSDTLMEEAADSESDVHNAASGNEVTEQSHDRSRVEDNVEASDSQPTAGESAEAGESSTAAVETGEAEADSSPSEQRQNQPNGNGLICPPDIDEEVFNSLPVDMQRDCVEQHRATQELAAQLDAGSSLDPEALAALPEDLRQEVIQQEQQERRMREQTPADPSNAEEMDNASFLASLAPDLREEILLTADDTFLNSLPPSIIAEAQILRERAAAQHRRMYDDGVGGSSSNRNEGNAENAQANDTQQRNVQAEGSRENTESGGSSIRRKHRSGKLRVERDRDDIVYLSSAGPVALSKPVSRSDVKALLRLLYLLSPLRPARLLQKVFQNLCANSDLRAVFSTVFVKLLNEDDKGAIAAIDDMKKEYDDSQTWRKMVDDLFSDSLDFPPLLLLGAVPEVLDTEAFSPNITMLRRKQGSSTAASIAANLPTSAAGSRHELRLPPVVATRIVDTLVQMCKSSPRFCLHVLVSNIENGEKAETSFGMLLDLLDKPRYLKSSANLEQLLTLLEAAVSPLSQLSKHSDDRLEVSQRDVEAAAAAGKEWVDVPRVIVSQERLQLLCSILRMETCRDAAFTKVNTIVRRLCRVEANRGYVLAELASVAHALGADAIRDLKALRIRMDDAVAAQQEHFLKDSNLKDDDDSKPKSFVMGRSASSSVTLSTSTSEMKLLRVLQTLQALCGDTPEEVQHKKNEGSIIVTEELVQLLRAMKLDSLWDELSACLRVVQVLEGVSNLKEEDEKKSSDLESNDDASDENGSSGKKLKNSSAGLLTRFLPSVEAFFVANASATRESIVDKSKVNDNEQGISIERRTSGAAELEVPPARSQTGSSVVNETSLDKLVGGKRLVEFVAANKVLLNALVRNNAGLLDKGLRGLVQVSRCRVFLDFDVKRQWFKTQVRRLRQHASRRHGSLRLHIRRKHVFEDTYHQLQLRNADEMRGRLHITFRNEEGVDAGGLSREFFGILAKEIFNPDYALFTSTEDGCTFQPNPNSSINPDHLSYFRFVGRIVGKAVADGFLLDAHFTRSLYKHMLGLKPTHHDMEAIDPDYYRNLKTILEYNLVDIGLDLTFSTVDHSFGRNTVIDLIPNGRNVAVSEEKKAEYVSLVCQHRMTTAISSQIKAYLDGFYELVSPELIAIFTPRELELLISGLPEIDIHDLKKNTDYVGWKATDKEIEWFWNVMFSLSRNEKAAFLQFVTGSSKVPLNGFSELQGMRGIQKFSIHKATGSGGALMSAHTCFNSLDLPVYNSEEELREKLLYAINEGVGAFMFA